MKKILVFFVVFIIVVSSVIPAYAADGKVSYRGNAENFVFEPGSEHSLTDLFPNFKGVMPGDSLSQKITVKNNADNKVKVKIYLRSLAAHEDSQQFLSKLRLKVKTDDLNEMAYMFDAAANETAQLTDWVCLGMLYSGGEVDLNVTLDVPVELDNEFQNKIGYLDWEFKVEEFPVEEGDPQAPQTGDDFSIGSWLLIMLGALAMLIILFICRKKDKDQEKNAVKR